MLTSADIKRIKRKIAISLKLYAAISPAGTAGILPAKDLQGKLYEVHVLSEVVKNLASKEGFKLKLMKSGAFTLKQKGSPINRSYPYFEVWDGSKLIGEIFTDTEFISQSYSIRSASVPGPGDYHELDIGMFRPGCVGRPDYQQVLLAIECKATSMEKSIFREVLGFRRELACLHQIPQKTIFRVWPIDYVNALPPSVHMCYSTDQAIKKYSNNAIVYGVLMIHEVM